MGDMKNGEDFYAKGKNYWENVPPTIDGMLGGHSNVFNADIQASSRFITSFLQWNCNPAGADCLLVKEYYRKYIQNHWCYEVIKDKKNPLSADQALDCGSGIGRITKHFLLKFFKNVDMVEQNKNFLDASHAYLEQETNRVSRRFNCGLQDFVPDENCYDLIWIQWVIGYLTDDDLVLFLERCKKGLKENGIIVIKDNLSSEEVDIDHEDGSVTRPRADLLNLIQRANLKIEAERKQYKFPKGLYEVKMFALR